MRLSGLVMVKKRPDLRRYSRIQFDAAVQMYDEYEVCWSCRLRDISLNGVLLTKPSLWWDNLGSTYLLSIVLTDSDIHITLLGTVKHVDERSIGMQSLSVSPQAQHHLQRLMEWNLADPAMLLRELSTLLAENGCLPH